MKKKKSLLDNYYNRDLNIVLNLLLEIFYKKKPLPYTELIELLLITDDNEVLGLILEIFYTQRETLMSQLVRSYQTTEEIDLKKWILLVFSIQANFESMYFIISEYMGVISLRPYIRSIAFKDKHKLLLSLARYVEMNTLSKELSETAQHILKLIPRKVYYKASPQLTRLRISDLYYEIPPLERAS